MTQKIPANRFPFRNETVAINLRKLLNDKETTPTKVAQDLFPGSRSTESRRRRLSRVVNGMFEPRLCEIRQLAAYFEVDPGDLAYREYDSWNSYRRVANDYHKKDTLPR